MSEAFLGRGWKFPVKIDPVSGRIQMSEHEQDIAEAIRIILGTAPGERVMRPDFGCGVHDYAFAQSDDTTLRLIEHTVIEAIRKWEPRVEDVDAEVTPDAVTPGKVLIRVSYSVRTTNNVYNQVYPFYLLEGIGQ